MKSKEAGSRLTTHCTCCICGLLRSAAVCDRLNICMSLDMQYVTELFR